MKKDLEVSVLDKSNHVPMYSHKNENVKTEELTCRKKKERKKKKNSKTTLL